MNLSQTLHTKSRLLVPTMMAALLCFGCDRASFGESAEPVPAPPATAPVEARALTLDLVDVQLTDNTWTVDVYYNRSSDQGAPRVMELQLALGEGLEFQSAVAGEALDRADKDLVAQERDGVLRLVAFASTNVLRIESGVIARLSFRVMNDDHAEIELLPRMPIFAPNDANKGLLLAEPLRLREGSP